MIKYIQIENFKSLKSLRIRPSNLNLCFGINGMGKSTLLQAMLLLRQSHLKGVLHSKGLMLNDRDLISLGSGKDVFHYDAGREESLRFEIHTDNNSILKWRFKFDAVSDILPFDSNSVDPHMGLDGYSLFNNNFQYLTAEHLGPQKQYPKSDFEVRLNRNIGMKGEYTAHYLSLFGNTEKIGFKNLNHKDASSDTLLHQTNAWLGEISPGTRLIIEDLKGVDTVRMGFQFETNTGYTNEFSSVNVGFGVLYVLPVVLSLLIAKKGSIVFIENPESHLHPKGQAAIGRLMALAAQSGIQIFCESHSDHIINGARVAVKNKELDPENLAIYYFDRDITNDEHKARITEVFVDQKGELSGYPEGLLDEWNNLLMQLI